MSDLSSPSLTASEYQKIWEHVDTLPWCALVTTGRAGSDFFQSLLDSHPEVFVLHGRLFFHTFWSRSMCARYSAPPDIEDLLDEFVGHHIEKFKSRYEEVERMGQLGEQKDASIDIDLDCFKTHAKGLLSGRPLSSRTFLTAVYVSYAMCLDQDLYRKRLFFHHVHHFDKLQPFLSDFPDAQVIAMTRDPRTNYVAGIEEWRRYQDSARHPAHPVYIMKRTTNDAKPLRRLKQKYCVMKLEESGESAVLRNVCDWLNISYNDCLERSTWAGLRWWGDQLSDQPGKDEIGYAPSVVNLDWSLHLGRIERLVLEYLWADRISWYGYPDSSTSPHTGNWLTALCLIPLPTRYELEHLKPSRIIKLIGNRDVRLFLGIFYHYARRVAFCYRTLSGRVLGDGFALPYFSDSGSNGNANQVK